MEDFVQMNVFAWICTIFAHLIANWLCDPISETGNLPYTNLLSENLAPISVYDLA